MFSKFVKLLSRKPEIFIFFRRLIEFNFITVKEVIKKEFSLNQLSFNTDNRKFLDLPCGTGEFSRLFNSSGYIGIDISQKYINYAKKMYKRKFYCRDARKTDFEDNYFDRVLMLGFLHHIDKSSIITVLKEIKRVLKKDGKILLIEDAPVESNCNLIGKILQHYDLGSNIRALEEYIEILKTFFIIDRYYPIRSGFWNYSVFVLSTK